MPGSKKRARISSSLHSANGSRILCLGLLLFPGKEVAQSDRASNPQPQAERAAQSIGTSSSFRGWRAEAPVLREEDMMDDGSVQTSFYSLEREGALVKLDPSTWQRVKKGRPPREPPGLSQGKLLVLGHQALVRDPEILLEVDADRKKVEALEQAIRDRQDGTTDAEKGFPEVQAQLRILWIVSGQKPVTLWQEPRTLSASAGEAGYRYSPPYLSLAVLSPTGKTLLVGVTAEDAVGHHLIAIPAKSK